MTDWDALHRSRLEAGYASHRIAPFGDGIEYCETRSDAHCSLCDTRKGEQATRLSPDGLPALATSGMDGWKHVQPERAL